MVRLEETVAEHQRLTKDFPAWCDRRIRRDSTGQYQTQLGALREFVTKLLVRIGDDLGAIKPTDETAEVYARCRENDQRLVLLHRFWEYYRRRWDQRDDTVLGPVLLAADEVVFSCYRQPFEVMREDRGPAPLPYIESTLSPHAVTRDEPPGDLVSADPLIQDYVRRLPVPVIGLPESCVRAPWLLVHLAHEAGHHVQHDLASRALIGATMSAVKDAARRVQADGDVWAGWSQEVFADAFALFAVGEAAPWAIAELELARDDEMLDGPFGYPPPVVRQALLRTIAELAGLDAARTLPGPTPTPAVDQLGDAGDDDWEALRMQARGQLAAVPEVARTLVCERIEPVGELRDLCRWNAASFRRGGGAMGWRDRLMSTSPFAPKRHPGEARVAIAGAVAAFAEVATVADAGRRRDKRELLRERLLKYLPQTRPTERRGARPPAVTIDELAREFGDELFAPRRRTPEVAGAR